MRNEQRGAEIRSHRTTWNAKSSVEENKKAESKTALHLAFCPSRIVSMTGSSSNVAPAKVILLTPRATRSHVHVALELSCFNYRSGNGQDSNTVVKDSSRPRGERFVCDPRFEWLLSLPNVRFFFTPHRCICLALNVNSSRPPGEKNQHTTNKMSSETKATATRISKLSQLSPELIGTFVKLHGWIYGTRTQGAGSLQFWDLGDGSTVTPTRCIAEKPSSGTESDQDDAKHTYGSTNLLADASNDETAYSKLSFDELTQAASLSIGCSVMLFGYVAEPPPGTTQTYEIKVTELFLIGGVQDSSKYPIQKSILKKPLALRSHYHARFRAPLMQQLMLIRSQTLFAIHEFFHQQGVPLLDPNIMTSSDCEGAGEIFKMHAAVFFVHQGRAQKDQEKGQGRR